MPREQQAGVIEVLKLGTLLFWVALRSLGSPKLGHILTYLILVIVLVSRPVALGGVRFFTMSALLRGRLRFHHSPVEADLSAYRCYRKSVFSVRML